MQEQHCAGNHAPTAKLRADRGKTLRASLCAAAILGLSVSGCASQSSNRFGGLAMPKLGKSDTAASMGSSIVGTGQTVKNQLSSVGSAVSSAYSKTKTAIAAPFSPASSSSMDTPESESKSTANPLSIAPETLVFQGNYFESQGNYTKALDSYSRALETEPKNAIALLSMARLYDRQKESGKSIEFYHKTIEAAPSNADACMELGKLYAKTGDLASAKTHLSKAVELQPNNKSYRQALAGALLDAGDATGSMSELSQCESPAMAQYQMAYLHFQRKNIPATQQHLSEALKIDPNLKPARDLLTSIGGAANIDQLVDRGRQVSQQASGIYQQAGVLANGISSAWNGAPAVASQASVQGAPSVTTPAANLLGIPVAPLPSNPAVPTAQSSEEAVRVRLGE